MNLQFFLKNPFVKIIGVGAIIYFGMFYNNDHPDSLRKRLSVDNVKKNLNEVQQKVGDISQTIEIAKQNNQQISIERNFSELKCGDEVNIVYKFYDDQNKILGMSDGSQIIAFQSNEDLILNLIAKNMDGLKMGAIIRTKFQGKYIDADEKIKKLLKIANYNLNLEVYVLSIKPNKNNCLKND